MRLDGKVVVVTGAATGIGRACAIAFAEAGASVVVGDVNEAEANATVGAIEAGGGTAIFVPTDVGSPAACSALVAAAVERFCRLDVMHANAGIELCKSIVDTTDEDWDRVMAVNQSGVFYCSREAMRHMRGAGRPGSIVITASPHAFMTGREIGAYAASKGGSVGLMRALALEGAPYGIRANAILPGAIRTPMIDREVAFATDPEEQLRQFAAATPLGRMGEPEDIAPVAVFLASDGARFVTGACYAADGGLMAALNSGAGLSYTD